MKQVLKNKIINKDESWLFDNTFEFQYLQTNFLHDSVEVFFMSDLLKNKQNKKAFLSIDNKISILVNKTQNLDLIFTRKLCRVFLN